MKAAAAAGMIVMMEVGSVAMIAMMGSCSDWQSSIVCAIPAFVKLYGDFSRYEQVVNK